MRYCVTARKGVYVLGCAPLGAQLINTCYFDVVLVGFQFLDDIQYTLYTQHTHENTTHTNTHAHEHTRTGTHTHTNRQTPTRTLIAHTYSLLPRSARVWHCVTARKGVYVLECDPLDAELIDTRYFDVVLVGFQFLDDIQYTLYTQHTHANSTHMNTDAHKHHTHEHTRTQTDKRT